MNILVIEDDRRISDFLTKGLAEQNFSVSLAENGTEARTLLLNNEWDIILIDIMIPEIDGIQLIQLVRYKKINTPIIAISALGELEDKLKGLDSGADDYLAKPFHFKELLARINALTRRVKYNYEADQNILTCGDLVVNTDDYSVKRQEKEIDLSPTEFKLLVYLIENKNKVLSRTKILNSVWGINFNTHTNVVDVYVSYLRMKIDDGFDLKLIQTIKGVGYLIKEV